jgi:hypothetical protein
MHLLKVPLMGINDTALGATQDNNSKRARWGIWSMNPSQTATPTVSLLLCLNYVITTTYHYDHIWLTFYFMGFVITMGISYSPWSLDRIWSILNFTDLMLYILSRCYVSNGTKDENKRTLKQSCVFVI